MNLIDLRKFEYKIDKIISFNQDEIIFNTTEYEEEHYKRYFYKYNVKNKHICRINKTGIDICDHYNNYILNNCIYTNSYKVRDNGAETFICRVNIMDGEINTIYSTRNEISFIFISERYLLLNGNNYEIDDEHCNVKKDIQGEYDYTILCDLLEKKEYEIKDKRVVLGIRDYFIPYTVDSKTYIVFEEAYMEDYELEELFKEGIAKEDFYKNGYRESINVITVDKFVESVKACCETIQFNQIHKTEHNSWTRYFGMDDENIYYRVKDFESRIQCIYSINKRTLEKQLLKSIQMDSEVSFLFYSIWYDKDNRKIYETKVLNDNEQQVNELMNDDLTLNYEGIKENFEGLIDNYFITSYWIEYDDGEDSKNFVKIKDTKSGIVDVYEGDCTIIKGNVILT